MQRIDDDAVAAWLSSHTAWTREGDAIVRALAFPDFASALAFAVKIGCVAERRDHHPDILIGWAKARVLFTTHDAGGITKNDLDAAEAVDAACPP